MFNIAYIQNNVIHHNHPPVSYDSYDMNNIHIIFIEYENNHIHHEKVDHNFDPGCGRGPVSYATVEKSRLDHLLLHHGRHR